jgi:hypothetical protein
MCFLKPNLERAVKAPVTDENRPAQEPVVELHTDRGPLPAPAWHFGITDAQQWIDLCA